MLIPMNWTIDGLYISAQQRTRAWIWLTRFLSWRLAARIALLIPAKFSPLPATRYAKCRARRDGGKWEMHEALFIPGAAQDEAHYWIDGEAVPAERSALINFAVKNTPSNR